MIHMCIKKNVSVNLSLKFKSWERICRIKKGKSELSWGRFGNKETVWDSADILQSYNLRIMPHGVVRMFAKKHRCMEITTTLAKVQISLPWLLWSYRYSTISSIAWPFWAVRLAAVKIVRIALTLRPCFPITLPKSFLATLNS